VKVNHFEFNNIDPSSSKIYWSSLPIYFSFVTVVSTSIKMGWFNSFLGKSIFIISLERKTLYIITERGHRLKIFKKNECFSMILSRNQKLIKYKISFMKQILR